MFIKNITLFIKSHPILFLLFEIIQIVTIIALLFSYFQYQDDKVNTYDYKKTVAQAEISFSEKMLEEIFAFTDELQTDESKYSVIKLFLSKDKMNVAFVKGKEYVVNNGSYFEGDEPEVIITDYDKATLNLSIGDEMSAFGQNFKIIGVRGTSDYTEFNYKGLDKTTPVYGIAVNFGTLPSEKTINEFSSLASDAFPTAEISLPEARSALDEVSFDNSFIACIFLMIISLINISYIFSYLLSERKSVNSIYLMCGCSANRLLFMYFLEAICYCLFSGGAGIVIFNLFIKDRCFTSYLNYKYYVFPILIFFAAEFLIMLRGVSKSIFSSPASSINKGI